MKVIKYGKIPKEEVIEMTCKSCGTEFEFGISESDIVRIDYGIDTYRVIKCPLCKRHITFIKR